MQKILAPVTNARYPLKSGVEEAPVNDVARFIHHVQTETGTMAEKWHHYPMYATALQQARASGDVQEMEAAAQRGESEGAGDPEVQKALAELRAEIARLRGKGGGYGNEPRPLYAEAMQQARASGDLAQMNELAQRARTEGAGNPEIQSALAELDAEIARRRNS